MGFQLLNAESQHRRYPDSFWIPDREARKQLKPGDYVKLVFEPSPLNKRRLGGERMWVEVEELRADGKYRGKLLNEPIVIDGAHWGDSIGFGPEHVISIDSAPSRLARNVIGGALIAAGAYGLYRLFRPSQPSQQPQQQNASHGYMILP